MSRKRLISVAVGVCVASLILVAGIYGLSHRIANRGTPYQKDLLRFRAAADRIVWPLIEARERMPATSTASVHEVLLASERVLEEYRCPLCDGYFILNPDPSVWQNVIGAPNDIVYLVACCRSRYADRGNGRWVIAQGLFPSFLSESDEPAWLPLGVHPEDVLAGSGPE